jgi:hypothetical protein
VVSHLEKAFPPLEGDRFLQPELETLARWLLEGRLTREVREQGLELA